MSDSSDLISSMIRKTSLSSVDRIIYRIDWEVIVNTHIKEKTFNELQLLDSRLLTAFIKGLEKRNQNINHIASIEANKQVIQFCQNVILNSKLDNSLPNKNNIHKSKKI